MSRSAIKMNQVLKEAIKHWKYVAPILAFPKSELDYKVLVKRLDNLLDIVGDDESHELISLVDVLSNVISSYEDEFVKFPKIKGVAALEYLMASHQLKQSELPEIGSQGVVSEILRGKRKLNLKQIKALAKRFKVDIATFIDQD